MDPATIIGGATSLAGALLGRNKQVKPGDVVRQTMAGLMGQARGAREVGEAYGFNPLTLLGVSQPLVPQAVDNSGFGQAIANAGLAVAEGLTAENAQKAYTAKLEEQNQDLRKALDSQTLRPKVAGIFGPQPGVAENVSVPAVSDSTIAARLGYPDRLVETSPIKDIAVVADVELPGGDRFPVLHDGDEIMGIEKLPIFAAGWLADKAMDSGRYWRRRFDAAGVTTPGAWLLPETRYNPDMKRPKRSDMFGDLGFE